MPKRAARRKAGVKTAAAHPRRSLLCALLYAVLRAGPRLAHGAFTRTGTRLPAYRPARRQEEELTSTSTTVLSRFGVTALLMLGWYGGLRAHAQDANLAAMALAAAASVAVVALARRETLSAGSLCRWDEAAAWAGIAILSRAAGV